MRGKAIRCGDAGTHFPVCTFRKLDAGYRAGAFLKISIR